MANWSWPVSGSITQGFGKQADGTTHPGIDIGVPSGTSVLAASGGKIIKQGWWGTGGNTVQIDNGNGTISQYMHLSKFTQALGAVVAQGQQIGISGASGIVTGPHLHFEVNQNGKPVDPMPLLTGVTASSVSNASPADIARAQKQADANAMAHAGFPDPFGILGKIGSLVTGASTVAASPIVATATGADYLVKAGGFLTQSSNWKRIGLGTLGAVILLIATLELTTKSGAIQTISKVA